MTDCYGNDDVMVMENTDAAEEGIRQYALINIGDSPSTVTLPADRYCLREWRFRERFGGNVSTLERVVTQGTGGREGGLNYQKYWEKVFETRPKFIMIWAYNHWDVNFKRPEKSGQAYWGDNFNVEYSGGIEPIRNCYEYNGVRVFCRGANRVPGEPFPSAETPEKIQRLVSLAREGGVNMLRVWGGGIFDHDAFYDACDEAGILVTQDFLMACGTYPEEDDGFIHKLSREACAAALRLRNHPSLVWWAGDNENAIFGDENKPDYNGRRAALEGIGPVLRELDPARRFLPSSPYGGVPYASGVRGTTHNTQFLGNLFSWVRAGDFTDYRAYLEQYLARFTAEQPAIGMPYLSSLRKFLTDKDIFGDDTAMSEYHTKNNPGLGDITLYGYVDRMAHGIFGEYRDGADRLKKMQLLHCEWIRLSMEMFRRHMWFSSGIIYWMYNDCWPAANGWSLVDYYQNPKPGYYAFKRAAAPVICSVTLEDGRYAAYVSNAGAAPTAGTVRLYRYDILTGSEDTLDETAFKSPAGSAQIVLSVPESGVTLDDTHILLCDLTSDEGGDRAFFLPLRWGDMRWPDARPTVTYTPGEVTVTAPETIPVLLLDAPCVLERNGMFLKRGETVRIPVTGKLCTCPLLRSSISDKTNPAPL